VATPASPTEAAVQPPLAATPTTPVPAARPVPEPAPAAEKALKMEKNSPQASAPVAKPAGAWGVQLAAVGTLADGKRAAAEMVKRYPALAGLAPRVTPAPDGKRYRVQFVGAQDRAAAAAVCAKLAGKQPCFPVSGQ